MEAGGRVCFGVETGPVVYARREILNAIVYLAKYGCTWRNLPDDLPPCRIVFHDLGLWQTDGT